MIAAIHFSLKDPIVVNKKKCFDIQFYTEGGTSVEEVMIKKNFRGEDEDDEEKQK